MTRTYVGYAPPTQCHSSPTLNDGASATTSSPAARARPPCGAGQTISITIKASLCDHRPLRQSSLFIASPPPMIGRFTLIGLLNHGPVVSDRHEPKLYRTSIESLSAW